MKYEWDPAKAESNKQQHGVLFADAALALEDELALTVEDDHEEESRFVTLGMDPEETEGTAETTMKAEYDFSTGKRGAVVGSDPGKTRITIRLDNEAVAWFKKQVEDAGGGSYQALINQALRDHIERTDEPLEETLRRVLKEELAEAR